MMITTKSNATFAVLICGVALLVMAMDTIFVCGFIVQNNGDGSNDNAISITTAATGARVPALPTHFHTTVYFPEYPKLMRLIDDNDNNQGFLASDPFEVPLPEDAVANALPSDVEGRLAKNPQFRVKLYPYNRNRDNSAGVGVHLQLYEEGPDGSSPQHQHYFDTTFSIRLQGRQPVAKERFDLEWKAGARFVPESAAGTGTAGLVKNEYGSILLPTGQLAAFMGHRQGRTESNDITVHWHTDDTDSTRQQQLAVEVDLVIHDAGTMAGASAAANAAATVAADGGDIDPLWKVTVDSLRMRDARWARSPSSNATSLPPSAVAGRHREKRLRVGSTVLPLLEVEANENNQFDMDRRLKLLIASFFSGTMLGGDSRNAPSFLRSPAHNNMFDKGVYPGIEYQILRIIENKSGDADTEEEERDLFFDQAGVDYVVQPTCWLPPGMERQWPARINEKEIPNLITSLQYNVMTAIGALSASASILSFFFALSLLTSLFFIPSCSMDPTLQVGDVLLVEKMTPRLPSVINKYKKGDVVLFKPPPELQEIVALNGGHLTDRDLFVKRVAALPGDHVRVNPSGSVLINGQVPAERRDLCKEEPLRLIERYIEPGEKVVEPGHVLLMGDCSSVSVDGRVWGSIDTDYIVGRPMVRTWPTTRMTTRIPDLPKTSN